jgi:H+/gluconate symporter-like permease
VSGFSKSIVATVIRMMGNEKAVISIVLVANALTYGGISLFAVLSLRHRGIPPGQHPKTSDPGTITPGVFSYTMDTLPATQKIQNIMPTAFFDTDAAPWLGLIGPVFISVTDITNLASRIRSAR